MTSKTFLHATCAVVPCPRQSATSVAVTCWHSELKGSAVFSISNFAKGFHHKEDEGKHWHDVCIPTVRIGNAQYPRGGQTSWT